MDEENTNQKTKSIIVFLIIVTSISVLFAFQKPTFPPLQDIDSPFATNDFAIPSGVSKVVGITTREQMEKEIETEKVPRFAELGLKWARLHPNIFGTFGWSGVDPDHDGRDLDFSKQDVLIKLAQENNIYLLAGISPLPLDTEWLTANTYVPENKIAYSSYIKQIVERYDGDGKDDMPGLKYRIKYWQLENEPDLHNKLRKQRGNPNFSNPEEYFEVLKLTYRAVKEADKESNVMINVVGIGQNMGDTSFDYLKRLNELGAEDYYDIFSYHVYPDNYETAALKSFLQKLKMLIDDKPIWITESGIDSRPRTGLTDASEKKQAAWIIKHYTFHIASGVKKIDWLSLDDMSPSVPDSAVAKYAGLLTFQKATRKLSYYTYKKMVDILEGSDWNNIQIIQEKDGVHIYEFTKNGKPIWVAWNDNITEKQIEIPGITSDQAKITQAVPKYPSGKEVGDYDTAFETDVKSISGGNVTMVLGESPVFVQEFG